MPGRTILCFGEIVWDALPDGIFLGGAPLNVAYHLNKLGDNALPVSRIGRDFLGEETLRRLSLADVPTKLIQRDDNHRTGAVLVSLDERGDASYEILKPASWDFIELDGDLAAYASGADALVFGSLATRSRENGRVLDSLLRKIPFSLCDVNLRKPYDDPENAREWASRASMVKLNDEELDKLSSAGKGASLEEKALNLSRILDVKTIIVTLGGEGAFVLHEGKAHRGNGPDVEVADTVGAGDAFTAAFLNGFLESGEVSDSLRRALKLGAFVAGRNGAQPDYDPGQIPG